MSEVKVNKVTPRSGTTLTIGDSGVDGRHRRMLEVISPGEDMVEGVVQFSECEGRYS